MKRIRTQIDFIMKLNPQITPVPFSEATPEGQRRVYTLDKSLPNQPFNQ